MVLQETGKARIIVGDALNALRNIPDNYIECCVTSPPYYGLRDYGVKGQLGLEESPQEYIDKMVGIFREVRRTLKSDGTLWVNIGDCYAGSFKGRMSDGSHEKGDSKSGKYFVQVGGIFKGGAIEGCKRKDLIGIPWMLAFALREDGWYLRQDIIWNKSNAMPESVKDRCTKSHEYIFLLSKSDRYYFDSEAIKEPVVGNKGNAKSFRGGGVYTDGKTFDNSANHERTSHGNAENTSGLRNKRDVWNVSTQGYGKAHFATFPEKLVEPCILAGSRKGGVILDPFLGSGTTAVVAVKHDRNCIGIELNPEYAELAKERIFKENS